MRLPWRVYSESTGNLDVTATRDEEGNELILHIANIDSKAVSAHIEIADFTSTGNVEVLTLSGDLDARNTPEQPDKIILVKKIMPNEQGVKYDFPAHSYTILKYRK